MITTAKELQERNEPLYRVMKVMFDVIGQDIDTFDFSESHWYEKHEWSAAQEKEFVSKVNQILLDNKTFKALVKPFVKNNIANRTRVINELLFSYAWKTVENFI